MSKASRKSDSLSGSAATTVMPVGCRRESVRSLIAALLTRVRGAARMGTSRHAVERICPGVEVAGAVHDDLQGVDVVQGPGVPDAAPADFSAGGCVLIVSQLVRPGLVGREDYRRG